jgi:hypothetical protein
MKKLNGKSRVEAREAKYGEKMIEVKVRFWTNNLAKEKDKILPKHAWSGGEVRIKANSSHGIKPHDFALFNSLMDLTLAIERVLIQHDISLHSSSRMKKYFRAD